MTRNINSGSGGFSVLVPDIILLFAARSTLIKMENVFLAKQWRRERRREGDVENRQNGWKPFAFDRSKKEREREMANRSLAVIGREVKPIGIARNDFTRPTSGLPAHPAREPVDRRRRKECA